MKLFNAGDFYLLSLLRVAVQSKDILNKVLRQTMDKLESKDIEAPSEVQRLQQQLDQVVAEHKTLKETLWGLKQEKERREAKLTSPTTLSPRPLRSVSVPQLSLSSASAQLGTLQHIRSSPDCWRVIVRLSNGRVVSLYLNKININVSWFILILNISVYS